MSKMICKDCGHKGAPKEINPAVFVTLSLCMFMVGGAMYLLLAKKKCKECDSNNLLPLSDYLIEQEIKNGVTPKKACKYCSEIIDYNATYCEYCSHSLVDNSNSDIQSDPVDKKICPHCLEQIDVDAISCEYCQHTLAT